MKLDGKRELIARTLNVGKERIVFNTERLSEIKEAITKQDIRDLTADGAISIKQISGRRQAVKRKNRRRKGSIRLKVNNSKREYVVLVRKLRTYLQDLRKKNKMSLEVYYELRKQIKAKAFKNKAQLRERLTELTKQ